jgi:hypothetical protein
LQVSGGPVIRMEEQKMEEQPVEHVKD